MPVNHRDLLNLPDPAVLHSPPADLRDWLNRLYDWLSNMASNVPNANGASDGSTTGGRYDPRLVFFGSENGGFAQQADFKFTPSSAGPSILDTPRVRFQESDGSPGTAPVYFDATSALLTTEETSALENYNPWLYYTDTGSHVVSGSESRDAPTTNRYQLMGLELNRLGVELGYIPFGSNGGGGGALTNGLCATSPALLYQDQGEVRTNRLVAPRLYLTETAGAYSGLAYAPLVLELDGAAITATAGGSPAAYPTVPAADVAQFTGMVETDGNLLYWTDRQYARRAIMLHDATTNGYWSRDTVNGYLYPTTLTDTVGIGTITPATIVHALRAANAATDVRVQNSTSGTASSAIFSAVSSAVAMTMGATSALFTTDGILNGSCAFVYTASSLRLSLVSANASGIIAFASGGTTQVGQFDASGRFAVGNISPSTLVHAQKDQSADTCIRVQNGTNNAASFATFRAYNDAGKQLALGIGATTSTVTGLVAAGMAFVGTDNAKGGLAIYAADSGGAIRFAAGGTAEQMVLAASGRLGIGTTAPLTMLHVVENSTGAVPRGVVLDHYATDTSAPFLNLRKGRGTASSPATVVTGDYVAAVTFWPYVSSSGFISTAQFGARVNGTVTSTAAPTDLWWYTGSVSPGSFDPFGAGTVSMLLSSGGVLTVGNQTTSARLAQRLALEAMADYGGAAFSTWSSASYDHCSVLDFNRSRSSTIGTKTVVQTDDTLGYVIWRGADGSSFVNAAAISGECDATPGSGDMPGRLRFWTTADGSSSLTERMRLDRLGNLGLGISPSSLFHASRAQNDETRVWVQNGTAGTAAFASFALSSDSCSGFLAAVSGSFSTGQHADALLLVANTDCSNGLVLSARAASSIKFYTGSATEANLRGRIDGSGNWVVGTGAADLATNATDGFLYIPTCAGTPTGTPTAYTGCVAHVYDRTNNKLYVYNGAWKGVTLA